MQRQGWSDIHAKFHQTLRQKKILRQQEALLVAVSGGQDSLTLIKLLVDLQPKWQWHLAIAHCDHRWSYDAGIAAHVQLIAQQWQLPFYLKIAPTPVAETEAAARSWRYLALEEIAQEQGFKCVLTAHTQSDRAETLLYNLIRGAGTDGLAALDWQRNLTNTIRLVRPLLNITRQETGEFCQTYHLNVWEDVANHNMKYARSRIRSELIPYLAQNFNSEVENHLGQTAEILREEVKYLQNCAEKILEQATDSQTSGLNRLVLRQVPLALQRRVIRLFWSKTINQAPSFQHIEAITQLIFAPNRTQTSSLPGGLCAEVKEDIIILS